MASGLANLTETGVEGIRKKYKNKDLLTASAELDGMDYDAETPPLDTTPENRSGTVIEVKADGRESIQRPH